MRRIALPSALAALCLVAMGCGATLTGSQKPTKRDVTRIAAANLDASKAIDLVNQRSCRNLPCLIRATTDEIVAVNKAADVAGSILKKLANGPCRTVVTANVTAWTRREVLVAEARDAWKNHHDAAAITAYLDTSWRIKLTDLFAERCI